MATLHIRSNSLPSKSHPVLNNVEDLLCRLKSSEETSTSVCADLANLRCLHEGIENMIQMPSIQQALAAEDNEKWTNELLEESLQLMDLCGFARDVLSLSKGSIQELQSTIRRSRGETIDATNTYMASKKKIGKMVKKSIKNFKSFNRISAPIVGEDSDLDLKAVFDTLKEAAAFDFTVLKSVLMFLCGDEGRSKKRSWSLVSAIFSQPTKTTVDADAQNFLKQMKSSEVTIQELEDELEAFYRTLVKARVFLLNALTH
ncbi:uncharacterized protein LOC127246489 [Andrographis paniculata]|uniref:uncharacterized protein LOC127246489 n=1 Tax=Andrographis paniculata TaxID=175694 RepID=UPI0021E909A0|nr:uncharacterized protein LOC127246489 [Andrographis paniculata]